MHIAGHVRYCYAKTFADDKKCKAVLLVPDDKVSYFWPVNKPGEKHECEEGTVTEVYLDRLDYPKNDWGMFMAFQDKKKERFIHWQAKILNSNNGSVISVPLSGIKITGNNFQNM